MFWPRTFSLLFVDLLSTYLEILSPHLIGKRDSKSTPVWHLKFPTLLPIIFLPLRVTKDPQSFPHPTPRS